MVSILLPHLRKILKICREMRGRIGQSSMGEAFRLNIVSQNWCGVRHLLFAVKIQGESCLPVLISGKTYIATSLLLPRTGDFIVFQNPKNREEIFVKKIANILPLGYEVKGLLSWSSSSKEFGVVNKNLILGKLILWSKK